MVTLSGVYRTVLRGMGRKYEEVLLTYFKPPPLILRTYVSTVLHMCFINKHK